MPKCEFNENNLKNRESLNKNILQCFIAKSQGFNNILKMKFVFLKCVLSARSENSGPATRDHVKSSKMRNETPLQL